ncbi:MAG TPA: NUDIX domain-containing protein [Acidimicrobiales bacterium]|nr:NUDIX domain-containing protein [Acidimicrobiales bacterium]
MSGSPSVGGGDPAALDRRASRILLIDRSERLLLFCMHDPERPHRGRWWITPGGGLEDDETFEDAARRELFEETGIAVDALGPMIHESLATWFWGERLVNQFQRFFVVSTAEVAIVVDGWEESERQTTLEHRWWTLEEIGSAVDLILPENLAVLAAKAIGLARVRETDRP